MTAQPVEPPLEDPRPPDPDDRGERFAEFAAQVIARQERDADIARRKPA